MRTHVDYRTADKKNYIDFCKKYPDRKLSFDEWYNIIQSFSNYFREHILETGERCKFLGGLGEFTIQKKRPPKVIIIDNKPIITLPIDWKKTKEKGKRVYNFNYDMDGYRFKWLWIRRSAIFKNKDVWNFKPTRTTSRLLTHYLRVDESYQHKYSEWNKFLENTK